MGYSTGTMIEWRAQSPPPTALLEREERYFLNNNHLVLKIKNIQSSLIK